MNYPLKATMASLFLILSFSTYARLLQIIHTNDLHSYFNGHYDGRGGYARLLTKINQLKEEAAVNGIEVLQVDGGDWGEGTSFFISENGSDSVKAIDLMGVEVAVIGNHDHMMGGNVLAQQIRKANPKTKFISANILQTPSMGLEHFLSPYVDMNKSGLPIRVIGLSTAAMHFQYQIFPGRILSPVKVGVSQAKKARKAGKKLVIALTHIGKKTDEKLARKSTDIDIIIGGHSHTKMENVDWVKNKRGKKVPIVQAWAHGLAVGSLLVDVKEGGGVEVKSYKLHEIESPLAENPSMANFVRKSAYARNQYFDGRWDEVIGETFVPMTGYMDGHSVSKASCWGGHMARMSREAAFSDVGVHLAAFEGVYKPPGEITYGDMIDNFPHIRKYGDQGWEISTILVRGVILRPIMLAIYALRNKLGVNFSGIYFKTNKSTGEVTFELEERSIQDKALYSVAFPAEVGFALKRTLPRMTARLFPGLRNTGSFYWPSMEEYIKENSPIQCE